MRTRCRPRSRCGAVLAFAACGGARRSKRPPMTPPKAVYNDDLNAMQSHFDAALQKQVTIDGVTRSRSNCMPSAPIKASRRSAADASAGRYDYDAAFDNATMAVHVRVDGDGKLAAYRIDVPQAVSVATNAKEPAMFSNQKIAAIYDLREAVESKVLAEQALDLFGPRPDTRAALLDATLDLEAKTQAAIEVCHECGHAHRRRRASTRGAGGNVISVDFGARAEPDGDEPGLAAVASLRRATGNRFASRTHVPLRS